MDVMEKLALSVCNSTQKTNYKCDFKCEKKGKCAYCLAMAEQMIAHGVTVQEWISVKDMLPQVETPVIVYGGNGISIDWLKDYGEQGLRWGNLCCGSYNAKYWQPMPQPPKGE